MSSCRSLLIYFSLIGLILATPTPLDLSPGVKFSARYVAANVTERTKVNTLVASPRASARGIFDADVQPPGMAAAQVKSESREGAPSRASNNTQLERRGGVASSYTYHKLSGVGTFDSSTAWPTEPSNFANQIICKGPNRDRCRSNCACDTTGRVKCNDDNDLHEKVRGISKIVGGFHEQHERTTNELCSPVCGCDDATGTFRFGGKTKEQWETYMADRKMRTKWASGHIPVDTSARQHNSDGGAHQTPEDRSIEALNYRSSYSPPPYIARSPRSLMRRGRQSGHVLQPHHQTHTPLRGEPPRFVRRGGTLSVPGTPIIKPIKCSGLRGRHCKQRCRCTASGNVECKETYIPGQIPWIRGSMVLTGKSSNQAFERSNAIVTTECMPQCGCEVDGMYRTGGRDQSYLPWVLGATSRIRPGSSRFSAFRMGWNTAGPGEPRPVVPSSPFSNPSSNALTSIPSSADSRPFNAPFSNFRSNTPLQRRTNWADSNAVSQSTHSYVSSSAVPAPNPNRLSSPHDTPAASTIVRCFSKGMYAEDNWCEGQCYCTATKPSVIRCDRSLLGEPSSAIVITNSMHLHGGTKPEFPHGFQTRAEASCRPKCHCETRSAAGKGFKTIDPALQPAAHSHLSARSDRNSPISALPPPLSTPDPSSLIGIKPSSPRNRRSDRADSNMASQAVDSVANDSLNTEIHAPSPSQAQSFVSDREQTSRSTSQVLTKLLCNGVAAEQNSFCEAKCHCTVTEPNVVRCGPEPNPAFKDQKLLRILRNHQARLEEYCHPSCKCATNNVERRSSWKLDTASNSIPYALLSNRSAKVLSAGLPYPSPSVSLQARSLRPRVLVGSPTSSQDSEMEYFPPHSLKPSPRPDPRIFPLKLGHPECNRASNVYISTCERVCRCTPGTGGQPGRLECRNIHPLDLNAPGHMMQATEETKKLYNLLLLADKDGDLNGWCSRSCHCPQDHHADSLVPQLEDITSNNMAEERLRQAVTAGEHV